MKKYQIIYIGLLTLSFVLTLSACQNQVGSEGTTHGDAIYPGSSIISKATLPDGRQTILETTGAASEVLEFYKNSMKQNGWRVLVQRHGFMALSKETNGILIDVKAGDAETNQITIYQLANV